jgi:hypothetical protein
LTLVAARGLAGQRGFGDIAAPAGVQRACVGQRGRGATIVSSENEPFSDSLGVHRKFDHGRSIEVGKRRIASGCVCTCAGLLVTLQAQQIGHVQLRFAHERDV